MGPSPGASADGTELPGRAHPEAQRSGQPFAWDACCPTAPQGPPLSPPEGQPPHSCPTACRVSCPSPLLLRAVRKVSGERAEQLAGTVEAKLTWLETPRSCGGSGRLSQPRPALLAPRAGSPGRLAPGRPGDRRAGAAGGRSCRRRLPALPACRQRPPWKADTFSSSSSHTRGLRQKSVTSLGHLAAGARLAATCPRLCPHEAPGPPLRACYDIWPWARGSDRTALEDRGERLSARRVS